MRVVFLDYLRVVAIFMVLLVHSCEQYYFGDDGGFLIKSLNDARWVTAFDSICRAAVPLFVMASAYLLFPVKRPTGEFLRRRLLRIGVPFALWSLVYVWRFDGSFAALGFNFAMTTGGHLWFVPMLMGLYLLMPLLSPWIERVSEKELQCWIALWLFTTLFPFLRHLEGLWFGAPTYGVIPYLYGECPWNGFGTFQYLSGFVGYMLLGYWFRKYYQPGSWRHTLSVALPLLLIGYAICAGIFFARIPSAGGYPVARPYSFAVEIEMSWEFCSLGVVMTVIGWFLLIRQLNFDGGFYAKVIRPLSEASFGVYLIHMLILVEVASRVKGRLENPLAILAIAVGTFVLSSLVSMAVRKLPKAGKWICG